MLHSLIVGFGLAGMAYAEQLHKNNLSYRIVYQPGGGSSLQAAGVFNPTILKRYTLAWKALSFYQEALDFYNQQAQRLNKNYLQFLPILKIFPSPSEHNRWLTAAGSPGLDQFLDAQIHHSVIPGFKSSSGFGKVEGGGRLRVGALQEALIRENPMIFREELFDHDALKIHADGIEYKGIQAKHLVFCQGFEIHQNPLFKLPVLNGCKGEFFVVEAPDWPEDFILKSSIFIVPLGGHRFWVGATFDWQDKSISPTTQGEKWLKDRLSRITQSPYRIVDHRAQVRPTVSDRRPLVLQHPDFKPLYALNGLGARGVLMAPQLSRILFEAIQYNQPIPEDLGLQRF